MFEAYLEVQVLSQVHMVSKVRSVAAKSAEKQVLQNGAGAEMKFGLFVGD